MRVGFPVYDDILHAVNKGINNAYDLYQDWSGGDGLGDAPESLVQVEIARSLREVCPFVTLEETVDYILEKSGSKLKGKRPRNSGSGRVDIIVWSNDDKPKILLEIKRAWCGYTPEPDARRLRQLLNRKNSIRHGFLVIYTSGGSPETIENLFKNIEYECDATLKHRIGLKEVCSDGEFWYWDAGCFSVDRI